MRAQRQRLLVVRFSKGQVAQLEEAVWGLGPRGRGPSGTRALAPGAPTQLAPPLGAEPEAGAGNTVTGRAPAEAFLARGTFSRLPDFELFEETVTNLSKATFPKVCPWDTETYVFPLSYLSLPLSGLKCPAQGLGKGPARAPPEPHSAPLLM